jgi:hypothetical protein
VSAPNAEHYRVLARAARARGEAEAQVFEDAARAAAAARRDHVDQRSSPLGARRHCAAVKRRVAQGAEGAAVIGRRHLLSQEALADELAALSRRPAVAQSASPAAPAGASPEALRAKLGLVGGGLR